jgi:DNA-binding LacI/PurR family transcriptional regulator
MRIDHQTQLQIAAEAVMSPKTVVRYFTGEKVHGASRIRIERAVKDLGLKLKRPARLKLKRPATVAP